MTLGRYRHWRVSHYLLWRYRRRGGRSCRRAIWSGNVGGGGCRCHDDGVLSTWAPYSDVLLQTRYEREEEIDRYFCVVGYNPNRRGESDATRRRLQLAIVPSRPVSPENAGGREVEGGLCWRSRCHDNFPYHIKGGPCVICLTGGFVPSHQKLYQGKLYYRFFPLFPANEK